MAVRLSRRKIATYYADQLLAGRADVARELAAYLIDTKRTREATLIIRDVEDALEKRGVMVADVASAFQLSDAAKTAITSFLRAHSSASDVRLRESVDATLLGGVRINTPSDEFDSTLRKKLAQLKATKV